MGILPSVLVRLCSSADKQLQSGDKRLQYEKTRTQRLGCLSGSAGDGGDEHDLVAVLEGVGFAAEEADVFVVDVDVDEAAELAVFAFNLGGESWECLVDVGEEAREIFGGRAEVFAAIGVAGEGGGKGNLDRHYWLLGSLWLRRVVVSSPT